MTWEKGMEVRLSYNPGRVGACTGRFRENGPITRVQVRFPDGTMEYLPEDDLEAVSPGISDDPYELLSQGKYGRAADFRRNLTYVHLSGRLANLLYSMGITETDFYPHQYKPLLTLLDSPANGLLIADEVGLGKTIEAGLIWTELRARYDLRRLLVVCPAMLREKWQDELLRRFGITADILDAAALQSQLDMPRQTSARGHAWIVSYQAIRPPREWKPDRKSLAKRPSARWRLADCLNDAGSAEPLVDLVICDEAHYMRNSETAAYTLGKLLRDVSDYVVLLSATPINLHNNDLFNLLQLVDPEHFRYRWEFEHMLRANQPLVLARDAALNPAAGAAEITQLLARAAKAPVLEHSQQLKALLENAPTDADLQARPYRIELANTLERLNLLGSAVARTRKRDVQTKKPKRDVHREPVAMSDDESALYRAVTRLTREFAWDRDISDGFLLVTPQRQVCSCPAAAAGAWLQSNGAADADLRDEYDAGEENLAQWKSLTAFLKGRLPSTISLEALRQNDSKYTRLTEVLKTFFGSQPKEKVILFTTFRNTAAYLVERLQQDGIVSSLVWGNMDRPKQEVIDDFRDDPKSRVLVSTEVAAEGVDLQFSRVLINYDLPWNPMRVEQRIGRIDRLGQDAELIHIWNLYFAESIDDRIINRLHQRLRLFEQALGEPEPIVGEVISRLESDLLTRNLSEAEENEAIERAFLAIENLRRQQEELERSASQMIAHGGMLLDKINAAQELARRITETDLLVYVRDFLNHGAPGHRFEQHPDDTMRVDIQLPPNVASAFDLFMQRKGMLGQSMLASGELKPCLFLNRIAGPKKKGIEPIHQFHPLIHFVSERLKEAGAYFYPLVALRLDSLPEGFAMESGYYIFCVKRWTFEGVKDEEVLASAVCRWDTGAVLAEDDADRLINAARLVGNDWLDVAAAMDSERVDSLLGGLEAELDERFRTAGVRKNLENSDRAQFQLYGLERHFQRQLESLQNVLATHRAQGRKGLEKATQGKIDALTRRVEVQRERIKQREAVRPSSSFVCAGALWCNTGG